MKYILALIISLALAHTPAAAESVEALAMQLRKAFEAHDVSLLDKLHYTKEQPEKLREYQTKVNKIYIEDFKKAGVKIEVIEWGKSTGFTPDMLLPKAVGQDQAILFGKIVKFIVPPTDVIVVRYPKEGRISTNVAFPIAKVGEVWRIIGLTHEQSEPDGGGNGLHRATP